MEDGTIRRRGDTMSQTKLVTDFTQGSIPKKMIRFAVPFMISNALQVLYALVDMIVVGQVVGSYGLSAVSVASQDFMFMTMICLGFSTGGQVYISQLIGIGENRKLNRTIGTLFTITILFGIVMSVLGLLFGEPLLRLLNTPTESFSLAYDYLIVCSIGILFTYGYNMISAVLRGMGDSRHPFLFIAIASVINMVLDILFVAGFGWKTMGAALATILGQGASFLFALWFLHRRKEAFGFDFKLSSFRIDGQIAKKLASLGIPFAMQSAAINISMMYVNALVNSVGVHASAVFGVGLKVDDIANKISLGVSFAVSSMVGQNKAAGKYDRVKRIVWTSWKISVVWYALFAVVLFCFPEPVFRIFTSDPPVLELAPTFVYAIVWSFPAMAIMKGTGGLIQGLGNARLTLVFAMLDAVVLRIGLSYLLGIAWNMGLFGFILGYGLAAYGTAIPGAIYFFSGRWKTYRTVVASDPGEEA